MSLLRAKEAWDRRDSRWSDHGIVLAIIVGFLCMAGGYVALRLEDNARVRDLVTNCLRVSRRTAADVNLNWLYWQSEAQLGGTALSPAQHAAARDRTVKLLRVFTPGERLAMMELISQGQSSHAILAARASADYQAAWAKAQTIDVSQMRLVKARTSLGSEEPARAWVRGTRFSCRRAYAGG